MKLFGTKLVVFAMLAISQTAMALTTDGSNAPECYDRGQRLSVDNQYALNLKQMPRSAAGRAFIFGQITRDFGQTCNRKGVCHEHFEVRIGGGPQDLLEIVYSTDFGDMGRIPVGAAVVACGDVINTYARDNTGPKSPSGSIIHWVHKSGCMDHEHGFVMVDERVYGFGEDRSARTCKPGVAARSE
jgi:hypothetical protein